MGRTDATVDRLPPAFATTLLFLSSIAMAAGVYPGKAWTRKPPAEAGLDAARLKAFSDFVRGRGCVTRHGYMIYTWGDHKRRGDVASAAKPWYSHFLFKAVEDGRIASLDGTVAALEPRLKGKDAGITWRHMANQTSCYGLAERPGTAFCYNDWQMALFWDLLFLKVYGVTYGTVDAKVVRPMLTDILQCEDKPTFMAFGTRNRPGRVAVSPRDFCRFGLLYLREGNWRGKQLVSRKHATMAVSSPLPGAFPRAGRKAAPMIPGQRSIGSTRIPDNQCDHVGSYSWLWWTNGVDREGKRHWPDAPHDAYGAFGHGGLRAMIVIPSLDVVLSWNDTRVKGAKMENQALKLLVASVARPKARAGSWPMPDWPSATPAEMGMDAAKLHAARDYALKGGGSGIITQKGRAVLRWGDQGRRYDLKSSTKSFGATALAIALEDGKFESLEDKAKDHHPTFGVAKDGTGRREWLDAVTLFHLATQTAGFAKPGGTGKLLFAPGTKWAYSDSGPNWLAECITLAYRRDLRDLMFDRVFTPIGIKPSDLTWRNNAYRPHKIGGIPRREFGSGISANVDAMARLGYLYLRRGRWQGKQILPEWFIDAARTTPRPIDGLPVVGEKTYSTASRHYGLLWWNNADGTLRDVPRDAYWSWGLYDSLIVVIPGLDIVVARAGRSFKGNWSGHYDKLVPFLGPIAQSVADAGSRAPYPPSPVIKGIEWAPARSILRLARGSDNWPCTWADDGHLYTAYGDGTGFKPSVPTKLSLGLARVEGTPPDIKGVNIRSPGAEQRGGGASGKKASGMLMVGGVLYMLARNAKNSQLAWSRDHGRTWAWADWRFTASFGYPTFLNFGRNYAGARDGFVYIYSHDSDSAYKAADRMVLARVPKGRIAERDAYEFLKALDAEGAPVWTKDIAERGAVFVHSRNCCRSGITYNAGLKRYLWCQILRKADARFEGGFGIYDAPEPWGPWTTAFFTETWDVGPGETSSLPTKWMSAGGKTIWLVFSGDDCFSVRKATLTLKDAP